MATTATLTPEQLAADLEATDARVRAFLAGKGGDATRKKMAVVSVAGVKEHFAQSVSPEGIPWAPLLLRSGKPLLDTGRLRNTVVAQVTADGVVLSANNVQARLMQDGGIVRPRGKFLAIPLTPVARRAGSPRAMAGLHFQGRKGANKGALVDASGKAQYALVPSVKIPARPYLGWSARTLAKVEAILATDLAKALGVG